MDPSDEKAPLPAITSSSLPPSRIPQTFHVRDDAGRLMFPSERPQGDAEVSLLADTLGSMLEEWRSRLDANKPTFPLGAARWGVGAPRGDGEGWTRGRAQRAARGGWAERALRMVGSGDAGESIWERSQRSRARALRVDARAGAQGEDLAADLPDVGAAPLHDMGRGLQRRAIGVEVVLRHFGPLGGRA